MKWKHGEEEEEISFRVFAYFLSGATEQFQWHLNFEDLHKSFETKLILDLSVKYYHISTLIKSALPFS